MLEYQRRADKYSTYTDEESILLERCGSGYITVARTILTIYASLTG
jgi:hypothetical protein